MADQHPRRPLTQPPTIPDGVTPTAITAGYEVKINLGNYESITSQQWVSADVAPGSDIAAAQEWANEQAKYAARAAVLPALSKRQAQTDSIWNSLPEHIREEMKNNY